MLSATYSQYVTKDLTLGMEVSHTPLRPGLSYSVGARYMFDTSILGRVEWAMRW